MLQRDFLGFGHCLDALHDARMIAPAVSYGRPFPYFYIAMLRFVDARIIRRVRHVHDEGYVWLKRIRDLARAEQTDFLLHVRDGANLCLQPGF